MPNFNNLHLLPEIIINMVSQYRNSKHMNEKLSLEQRLETVRDYVIEALPKQQDKYFNNKR